MFLFVQSVEMTDKGIDFLKGVFTAFDIDGVSPRALESLVFVL